MSNKIKKHVQCPTCGRWISPKSIVFGECCKSCTRPLRIKYMTAQIVQQIESRATAPLEQLSQDRGYAGKFKDTRIKATLRPPLDQIQGDQMVLKNGEMEKYIEPEHWKDLDSIDLSENVELLSNLLSKTDLTPRKPPENSNPIGDQHWHPDIVEKFSAEAVMKAAEDAWFKPYLPPENFVCPVAEMKPKYILAPPIFEAES